MGKYYTRACNFYYGLESAEKVKKLSLPLHGNKLISFDTVEIISRKNKKKINVNKVSKLNHQIKNKILLDINRISKKNF